MIGWIAALLIIVLFGGGYWWVGLGSPHRNCSKHRKGRLSRVYVGGGHFKGVCSKCGCTEHWMEDMSGRGF